MIIDFHTHTFPAKISASVIEKLGAACRMEPSTDGSADGLLSSMDKAGIDYSVNLAVMTNTHQIEKIHDGFIAALEQDDSHQRIINFGGMHPDYENYRTELHRLHEHGIQGIKIHPAYQSTDFDDIRYMRIIEAASEEDLIVLTHAGMDAGIYTRNFCSVQHILNVLRTVAPPKLVLAHMGNWDCWQQVESDLAGGPVWLDTAVSMGHYTPNHAVEEPPVRTEAMADDDFVRLSRKHGTDKILFGTDCPWMEQSYAVEKINSMPFTENEKRAIFSENASRLLSL